MKKTIAAILVSVARRLHGTPPPPKFGWKSKMTRKPIGRPPKMIQKIKPQRWALKKPGWTRNQKPAVALENTHSMPSRKLERIPPRQARIKHLLFCIGSPPWWINTSRVRIRRLARKARLMEVHFNAETEFDRRHLARRRRSIPKPPGFIAGRFFSSAKLDQKSNAAFVNF